MAGLIEIGAASIIEKALDAWGVTHERSPSIHRNGVTIEVPADMTGKVLLIEVRMSDDEVV